MDIYVYIGAKRRSHVMRQQVAGPSELFELMLLSSDPAAQAGQRRIEALD
jgi:hypothetical protein